jgi:hypothetical protein
MKQSFRSLAYGSAEAGMFKPMMIALLLIFGVSLPHRVYAQGTTATLGGTIMDSSGAVIPQATVQLKNTTSGDLRTTQSNGSGVFSFSAIPSGDYTLDIKAKGFSTFEQTGVHLDPGDERSIRDIKLGAGSTESVVVSSAVGNLNTDSGELSNTISSEEIQHLAVEGRDVTELLKILPGMAINNGTNTENRSYDPSIVNFTGALGAYSGNGTPQNATALLSDGVDITDPGSYGIAIQAVNYDQVAEVKVQTGSFTADTARGPVVINAIGKSGGDKFHGSLYTYARTSQLNSVDWIANHTQQGKPPDRDVYPGGTLGGPILIPGTNFNHNRKLTFFVGAEDYAQRNIYAYGSASSAIQGALVPTAGMHNGDFSVTQLQEYLGALYQPTSPGAGCNNNYGNVCAVPQTAPNGTPVINGQIGQYLDPEMKLVLASMPLPNLEGNLRSGAENFITTSLVNNNNWQAKGRVDYAISDKNRLFATYGIQKGIGYEPNGIYSYIPAVAFGNVPAPGGGEVSTIVSHIASLNFSTIFSPTLTNEFYAAGAYFSQRFSARNPLADSKVPAATASGNPYPGLYNNGSQAIVSVGDYGADGLPFNTPFDFTFGGYYANKQIRTVGDNVTKLLGKHTLRAGIFYQWDSNPQSQQQNTNGSTDAYYLPGSFNNAVLGTVYGTNSNLPAGSSAVGIGGNYLADQLEGQFFQFTQASFQTHLNIYFWNLSGYVQDHWRVTPRLSVDYGVRLEHFTPWIDAHGTGIAVFDPADYAATAAAFASSPHLPGIVSHATNPAVPLGGVSFQTIWPDPRVGFAWDVYGQGKTTFRGGAGSFRQHDSYNDVQNPLNTAAGQGNYTCTLCGATLATLGSYQNLATSAAHAAFAPDQNVSSLLKGDNQQPVIYTYNLALDQQLPHHIVFEIAYAGNRNLHLINSFAPQNINALPVGSLFKPYNASKRPDIPASQAAAGNAVPTDGEQFPLFVPANSLNNTSLQNLQQAVTDSYRLYPLYNQVNAEAHTAYANYNGLQTQISETGRYGRVGVNYTWSKSLGAVAGGDPTNIRNDYNLTNYNRKHILNVTYTVLTGKLVKERAIGWATNGWEFSGYIGYQSGPNMPSVFGNNLGLGGTLTLPTGTTAQLPGQAASSTCTANPCQLGVSDTYFLGTPDVALQPTLISAPQGHGTHVYAKANAFGLPALGTNGLYHLGYFPGPAFFDTDLSATRNFSLGDHGNLSLRVAAFNFINHPNISFSGLDTTATQLNYTQTVTGASVNTAVANGVNDNANFGTANFAAGRRIIELSLRYNF